MNCKQGIELTNEEFFFLGSLFDCDALIGVPDPFIGYWVEEIDGGMKRAAASLIKKGYIAYKNNEVEIAPELLEYVKVCTKTNVTLWLQTESDGREQERYYYLSPRKVIESQVFEEGDRISYQLHDKGSPDQAWEELLQEIKPDSKPVLHQCRVQIPMHVFTQLLEERSNQTVRRIEAVLREYQVLPTEARLLAKTIKNYEYYGQFTAFHYANRGWCMDGLRLLYGKEVNWLIRPAAHPDSSYAEICPVSPAAFREAMRQVVLRSKQPAMPQKERGRA